MVVIVMIIDLIIIAIINILKNSNDSKVFENIIHHLIILEMDNRLLIFNTFLILSIAHRKCSFEITMTLTAGSVLCAIG